MITRRGLLGGILGACVAPAIVHNPMRLWVPRQVVAVQPDYWGISIVQMLEEYQRMANEACGITPVLRGGRIGQIDRFTVYESSGTLLAPASATRRIAVPKAPFRSTRHARFA